MMTLTEGDNKGVVVILDDDHFLADMYSVKFMQKGFTVETHDTAKGALGALRAGLKPRVILFDIVMPDQDGFDFLSTIRSEKLAPEATLIALTNQNNDSDRAHAAELGADEFFIKASMIPSEVVTAVVDAIGKKK